MKLKIFLIALIAALLLTLASSAQAARLGPGEARAATFFGLQRFYGWEWTEGSGKRVNRHVYCYNPSHCQTSWEFFPPISGEFCYGDAIIWRNRYGEIWYHIHPSPENRDPACR